jgi:hypothetical protein
MPRRFASVLLFLVALLAASRASADPLRIVIAASHTLGRTGERPLRYADDDAKNVRDVFVRLGGVLPERAVLLVHPSAEEVLRAIDHAASLAAGQPTDQVSVVFYFSGHGDRESIHLGEERLPIDVIEARLRQVNAGLRIVVLDACRTDEGRPKGFADADPFAVALPSTEPALGTVRLHASADGEAAQESDELAGAVFTHYWVNGLLGAADTNGDGQVTLAESYDYAYQQTLWRSSLSSGVAQRASSRIDLHEAAPLVLTRTRQSSAVRFPLSADTHYLVFGVGSQSVVGDLWGSPERRATLALKPGHYIVYRRGGAVSSAADVTVGHDEIRDLSTNDFLPVPEETLARKGGDVVLRPNELSVGYAVESTSRLVALGQVVDVRLLHAWEGWALGGGVHAGAGALDTSSWNTTLTWIGGEVLVERRIRLGWPTLRVGGGVTAEYVWQALVRADAATLAGTPYATKESSRSFLAGARATVGARFPVTSRVWVDVEGRGDVLATQIAGAGAVVVRGAGGAQVGVAF